MRTSDPCRRMGRHCWCGYSLHSSHHVSKNHQLRLLKALLFWVVWMWGASWKAGMGVWMGQGCSFWPVCKSCSAKVMVIEWGALDPRSISATVLGVRSCAFSLCFYKSQGHLNHSGNVCMGCILTVLVKAYWKNKRIYTYVYIYYRNWLILDSNYGSNLISSRHTLIDTPRPNVLPAIWTPFRPVKLIHTSKHHTHSSF